MRLPIVKLEVEGHSKLFYVDRVLEQYRNVDNPHEYYAFEDVDGNLDVILKEFIQ